MNKKGAFTDIFVYLALSFVIVIFMVAMTLVANTSYEHLQNQSEILQAGLGPNDNASQIINDTIGAVNVAYSSFPWSSVMRIVGMFISLLITSYLVRTNPVFFVAFIFISIIAIVISVPLSNSYEIAMQDPGLSGTFVSFTGANWIFLNLPVWITVVSVIGVILLAIQISRSQATGFG